MGIRKSPFSSQVFQRCLLLLLTAVVVVNVNVVVAVVVGVVVDVVVADVLVVAVGGFPLVDLVAFVPVLGCSYSCDRFFGLHIYYLAVDEAVVGAEGVSDVVGVDVVVVDHESVYFLDDSGEVPVVFAPAVVVVDESDAVGAPVGEDVGYFVRVVVDGSRIDFVGAEIAVVDGDAAVVAVGM